MIRQTISCDICGAEMLNANHWFVAREMGAELRVSVWDGQNRIRSPKHLCGHKCLHKLLDDFMARSLQGPVAKSTIQVPAAAAKCPDASVPSAAAQPIRALSTASALAEKADPLSPLMATSDPPGRSAVLPHRLHADAWKRERDRQQRAVNQRSIA